jgi:hypothetical protein
MYSEGDVGIRTDTYLQEVTSSKPLKQLVVSVVSKEVRLPENEVTLSAYTVPAPQPGEQYKYEWILLSQPGGGNSGTMNDQNGETLKLSNLIEGLYKFKVSVSAQGAYGVTYANVTVLPRKSNVNLLFKLNFSAFGVIFDINNESMLYRTFRWKNSLNSKCEEIS